MKPLDIVGHAGHRIHIARSREARMLFAWLGDLSGRSLLDVGGGDGFWAAQAQRRGATAFSVDLDPRRLERGRRFSRRPILIRGDALQLPFADGAFDAVMSVSSIEHFACGKVALAEMARVLRPGGSVVFSADSLAGRETWPRLAADHMRRYQVVRPFDHRELIGDLADNGLESVEFAYMFKRPWANRLYLELSRHRLAWNVAAPISPVVALSDRRDRSEAGSIVLIHARHYR